MTQPIHTEQAIRSAAPRQQEQPEQPANEKDQDQKEEQEEDDKLDEAIEMTFPASDPVSI